MTILEIQHWHNNELIWQEENLPNTFHQQGEQFILSTAFSTSAVSVPSFYYAGLDNRTTINATDTMSALVNEPSANVFGYNRQPLSSTSGFSVALNGSHYKATSGVVTFQAIGGSYGPVQDLFLATSNDNSGLLISSVPLSSIRTLNSGDQITARIGLSLVNCVAS